MSHSLQTMKWFGKCVLLLSVRLSLSLSPLILSIILCRLEKMIVFVLQLFFSSRSCLELLGGNTNDGCKKFFTLCYADPLLFRSKGHHNLDSIPRSVLESF